MIELFQMGGMLFMSLLTLLLIGVVIATLKYWGKVGDDQKELDLIKSLGLLALVIGILGQMIGLFDAFEAIQQMGSVSPAMLAGGLKVSSITSIYGVIIYAVSLIIWIVVGKLKS